MERKEDTPVRKTRRKYEEKNKEKRKQASGNFGTMIPRALFNEINEFRRKRYYQSPPHQRGIRDSEEKERKRHVKSVADTLPAVLRN